MSTAYFRLWLHTKTNHYFLQNKMIDVKCVLFEHVLFEKSSLEMPQ